MKRALFLLFALLVGATQGFAERISPEQALTIANNRTRAASGMKTRVGTPTEFTQIVSATDCYYVAAPASGRGFAIIAADDAVASPVGAYSPDAPFPTDTADMPQQMRAWLSDYTAVVRAIASGRIPPTALNPELKGEPVAPMLTTKWEQSAPFSNICWARIVEL